MTNFERITASPEALADFLDVPFCDRIEGKCSGLCRECHLDWLNSEAEEKKGV